MKLHAPGPLTAALAAALGGCAAPVPPHDTEPAIARAVGLPEAIEFRTEGGPVDEPTMVSATLSLADAVRRAVHTDPALQAALARVRIALAESHQSRLLPNPILGLALRFPEGSGKPIVEASLAQDIVAILKRPRAAAAADNRLRMAAAEAVTVALDTAADVQERYAAAQAFDELIPLLEQRRQLLGTLLEHERSKLAAGEGTRQDVATAESQRVELEVEIDDAQRRRRDERLRLARLIGEPSARAEWTLERWTAPTPAALGEVGWIDIALAHRPEVQAAEWNLAALGDEAALAGYAGLEGAGAGLAAERDGAWSVGPAVDLPVPVFDTGQARSARLAAEQARARHELTLAKRRVVEEVRRAHGSLAAAESTLRRVRVELIPMQEQRRSLAESAFKNGLTDITPLFLAEQDLRGALAKAVDLEREASIALVQLQRAVGGAGIAAAPHQASASTPDH